jgi:hypothetical protein
VARIKEVANLCQVLIVESVQKQEDSVNKTRTPAPVYKERDKVWLDLRNYHTPRPKKSLDTKYTKYTVDKVLLPVSVRLLRIPSNIYLVFYTDLLRPAA